MNQPTDRPPADHPAPADASAPAVPVSDRPPTGTLTSKPPPSQNRHRRTPGGGGRRCLRQTRFAGRGSTDCSGGCAATATKQPCNANYSSV
jgi:hypothetical protein